MEKQMKKLLALLICTALILGILPISALAVEAGGGTVGSMTWEITEDGELTVSGTGAMQTITSDENGECLPWLEWYTDDNGNWVQKYPTVTSVTIEEGITTIADYAFSDSEITEIIIPDSVTSIGESAFQDCKSLDTVTISSTSKLKTVGIDAFYGCEFLTELTLPDSVTTIGAGFIGGTGITEITIPKRFTTISTSNYTSCLFEDAINLDNVVLADGIKTIPENMFNTNSYSYISSVTLPDTVTTIGDSAFYGMDSLATITLPAKLTTIGESAFYDCDALTEIDIPNTVSSIGSYAFSGCDELTAVTLNYNSKTIRTSNGSVPFNISIGDYAFSDCKSLTSVTLSENVTAISNGMFSGCEALGELTIPNSVTTLNSRIIEGTAIESITIPQSVSNVNYPFDGALYLESVAFADGTTRIPNSICATNDYSYITSVVIPNTVTEIGDSAFYSSNSLTSVTLPEGLTTICENAFAYSAIEKIDIPNTVSSIGSSAFSNCTELTTVTLNYNSGTVRTSQGAVPFFIEIGDYAFDGCAKLTTVGLTENVTSIGTYAFDNCSSLSSLELPESLTVLGTGFIAGTEIASITIPKNFTTVNTGYYYSPFEGALYLESVTLGDGLKKIPDYMFDTITYSYIETINIPESVTEIGTQAFYGCDSLTEITIPAAVEYIYYSAFEECPRLTKVTFAGDSPITFESSAFGSLTSDVTVEVPEGSYDADNGAIEPDENNQYPYIFGAATVTIKRPPTALTASMVKLSRSTFTYTGIDIEPQVTVTDGEAVLTMGDDYTVTYSDNVDVGTGTVTVEGKNHYTGTVSKTFSIEEPKWVVSIYFEGELYSSEEYDDGETVRLNAGEFAIDGMKFSHWAMGSERGTILSRKESFSFIAKSNMALYPVFVEAEQEIKIEPTVAITRTVKATYNSKKAIGFTFQRSVPTEYKVISTGLLYGTNKYLGYSENNTVNLMKQSGYDVEDILKNNTTGLVKTYTYNTSVRNGCVSFKFAVGTNTTAYVYAMAYVTVQNSEGETETFYGEPVAVTYNLCK